jgi:hypothetical protein
MVSALDEVVIDVVDEGHEGVLGLVALFEAVFCLDELQHLLQDLVGEVQKVRGQCILGHFQTSKR